jgi:hypothetical protein
MVVRHPHPNPLPSRERGKSSLSMSILGRMNVGNGGSLQSPKGFLNHFGVEEFHDSVNSNNKY